MSYAVIIHHSFDARNRVMKFEDYNKAKAYLHWIWEVYYNEEIDNGSYINEADCWHEDEFAQVTHDDGCWTYFELTTIDENPEEKFLKNWKSYL